MGPVFREKWAREKRAGAKYGAGIDCRCDNPAVPDRDDSADGSRRTLAVGAIIRDGAGRFLLVQRGREPQAGLWSVPGGKVEAGETLSEAVIREVAEETGLDVEVGERVWVLDIPDGRGGVFEVHDFIASARSGELVAGDDAADVRWVDRAELLTLPVTPLLLDYLRRHAML